MAKKRAKPPPKPDPGNPWPEKLRALRKKHGNLTQVQAAERAGVAARTWISWENSQRTPSRIALRLLKEAFPKDF